MRWRNKILCFPYLAVAWLASTLTVQAQCSLLSRNTVIAAGDVFAIGGGESKLDQNLQTELPSRRSLQLLFIVPNRAPITDGALIVKSLHTDDSGKLIGSPDWIALKRDRHITACHRATKDAYSQTIPLDRYNNYHFYEAEDFSPSNENLDTFHTEVGMRTQAGYLGSSTSSCLMTNNRMIRHQFMFEDERRRAPFFVERTYHVADSAIKAFSATSPAQARPLASAVAFGAQIVPYARNSSGLSCVLAKVDIPSDSRTTMIMVIDADDAMVAGFDDPQHKRLISWRPRYHRISGHR